MAVEASTDLTRERFSRWRLKLLFSGNPDFEFLAHISMGLDTIFTNQVPTAGVTDDTLFINPTWAGALTDEEGVGVLAHEILHIVFGHSWRRGDREHLRYNLAADLVINQEVKRCGLVLPKEGQFIEDYGFPPDKSSEQYYQMLEGRVITLSMADLLDPSKMKEVMDKVPEECRDRLQRIIEDAVDKAEKRGKGLSRQFMELLFPRRASKRNWRELVNFLIEQIKSDYSWLYPSRRGQDLPSLRSLGTKKVIVAVDCSGSCWDAEIFKRFAEEITSITDQLDVDLELVYHDDQIQKVEQFYSGEFHKLAPVGNGGTNHRPVFKWIAENSNGFDPVVCLTDLETVFPDTSPPNPVIWACVRTKATAPFGKVVHLEKERT
jgi:predicted metal-dependent peptidase